MCVSIGPQVCFRSDMKHENDLNNMVGCLQAVRIYSFMREMELYIRASYIVFIKTKNNSVRLGFSLICS